MVTTRARRSLDPGVNNHVNEWLGGTFTDQMVIILSACVR